MIVLLPHRLAHRCCILAAMLAAEVTATPLHGQVRSQAQVARVTGHRHKTERAGFDETMLRRLRRPTGFEVNVFARGLGGPRMMALGPDGTVYVTRRDSGDVLALRDRDGDGRADETRRLITDMPDVHGITVRNATMYLVTIKEIYAVDLRSDGSVGERRRIVDDLPDAGQHPNRTIAFGPDGMLYVTVGSTCNACDEPNPEHATILQLREDGSARRVYARGLRNTIGFGWHPRTGQLWAMDNGTDSRGDDVPPEELNRISAGAHYGWPFCLGHNRPDKYGFADPPGTTVEAFCPTTVPPALTYTAHSAPIAMLFYTGAQFPNDYHGDAFVALHGSWNREAPSGYRVVRVRYSGGNPVRFEEFLSGFYLPERNAHFGRPAGLVVASDGALLVSDDSNGVIYRLAYDSTARARGAERPRQ